MTSLRLVVALSLLAIPMPGLCVSASAATAHNSQAGAYGPTTNNNAPTHRHLRKKTTR